MKFISIFDKFPVMETENYILRELRIEDAADLYEYYSDREVYQYLDWDGPRDEEDAKKIIGIWRRWYNEGQIIRWAIVPKESNKVIGTIMYSDIEGDLRADIGYELSKEYWKQGVMSEVLERLLSFGFEKLKFQRIQAIVRPENIASQALLRKFGFEEEGLLKKFEYHIDEKKLNDMIMFSLVK